MTFAGFRRERRRVAADALDYPEDGARCAAKGTLSRAGTRRPAGGGGKGRQAVAVAGAERVVLRIDRLCKSYREGSVRRDVLRDASASFVAGEFVAVAGRSGSGKSTLLNLVGGVDVPDSGSLWFEGRDLAACPERERTLLRRARMGYVFQFFNLIPSLDVEENLRLPLELNRRRRNARPRIDAMLERVGLAGRNRSFPERLSGGEQQRVAIARALVHEPALVLADEPTGNLDAESAAGVIALLRELATGEGRLLLLATHSEEAAAAADRVLRLERGRLVEAAQ